MIESKLISLLKSFNPDELKLFEKFVVSPYFSEGRDVSGYFKVLKKYYPDFDSEDLERENLYFLLFPGERCNESKLKNLSTALFNLAENFLIHEEIKNDSLRSSKILAEKYIEKNCDKLFISTYKRLYNKAVSLPAAGTEGLNEITQILRLNELFLKNKNRFSESIPLRIKVSEYFSLSYLINYIKRLKDKLIFPVFYNIPFDDKLLEAINENINLDGIVENLRSQDYELIWLLDIYHNIYRSQLFHKEQISEDYYKTAKELFYKNITQFTGKEKFNIFDSMVTYCVMRDPENQMYTEECFEVYKRMLSENAYSSGDKDTIAAALYGNIMLWAVDVNDFDWLNDFIEKYSDKLRADQRDNMTHFAKANLCFGKKDFEKSLYHISRVKNDFLLYKIQVRNLKLKIFYELELFDQSYSQIDSYRHYLSENKEINIIFKDRALDFLNIFSLLIKAKSSGNIKDLDLIIKKTESMLGYELRPWITQKINELSRN